MRRTIPIALFTLALVASVVFSSAGADPPAPTTAPPGCTKIGTEGRDILTGDRNPDHICALGGNDYVASNGQADTVHAGSGSDTVVGGKGRDVLFGSGGPDRLFAIDEVNSNDVLRGGAGNDRCFGEHGDHFFGCEHVYRVGTSPAVDAALAASFQGFLGLAELGEEFQNASPPPPSPPPPGTSPLPTFPACTPPPPVTPGGTIGPCFS